MSSRDEFVAYSGDIQEEDEGEFSPEFLAEIRARLLRLSSNAHVRIRDLKGELKEDFDSLARQVNALYNTENYPQFYNEVMNYFTEENYRPGTVGAYCGGCILKEKGNLMSRGCTVICAGSVPPPYNEKDWDFCDELVIWAVYNGKEFEFTTLNEVEDNSRAIIFIDYPTMEEFPGFSEEEKETLAENGIKEVKFMYYNPGGCPKYIEVSHGYIPLSEVKTRGKNPPPPPPSSSNFGWWIFLLFVVFVLVLFLIYFRR